MEKYLHLSSRGDKIGLTLIRLSIAIVFMWIGLLKFVPYEADSITPFVANSPLMSFFYEHPEDYKQYLDLYATSAQNQKQGHGNRPIIPMVFPTVLASWR